VSLGAEGSVVVDEVGDGVEGFVVSLPLDGPGAVIGVEDGDIRLNGGTGEGGTGFGELFAFLRDFGVEGDGGTICAD